MTITQRNSSIPQQHQRRLSTAHLAGLSILTEEQSANGIKFLRKNSGTVLSHALICPAVLLLRGIIIKMETLGAGYVIVIVQVDSRILESQSLKSSDNVRTSDN